ncbi:MAG TPA: outer membrane protein assembly factor BamD [Aliidongia sp.]|nr:outer membrane protein assembly factor BamD [Aliidongia sp.]
MVTLRIPRGLGVLALAACFVLMGCNSTPKDNYKEQPVEFLYNAAVDQMEQHNWSVSARIFDEVERQHPYSIWATKAQLMQSYVNYENNHYDEAIAAADRFIQLHPGNHDTPYAYYIKAISYYEQIVDVQRDQANTQNAAKALQDVVTRFPDSKYARDARLKLDLTKDHLAGKEMEIGRYYERQGLYIAAINRFQNVVKNYQSTTHVPEALARLVECYSAVGLPEEAKKDAAVLGYNFPDNEWYQDSYDLVKGGRAAPEETPNWIARILESADPF